MSCSVSVLEPVSKLGPVSQLTVIPSTGSEWPPVAMSTGAQMAATASSQTGTQKPAQASSRATPTDCWLNRCLYTAVT